MRPVPRREDLLALRHTARLVARLQLGGLPREPVIVLIGSLAGGKPGEDLLRLETVPPGIPSTSPNWWARWPAAPA